MSKVDQVIFLHDVEDCRCLFLFNCRVKVKGRGRDGGQHGKGIESEFRFKDNRKISGLLTGLYPSLDYKFVYIHSYFPKTKTKEKKRERGNVERSCYLI